MSSSLTNAALKACRHFMLPVARFLLRNGVGYREFAEISKLAFVQVASDEYGLRGRQTNMSRVSVMTGLNRKEIRKLRDRLEADNWELDTNLSKPAVVLAKWFTNPNYIGPKGSPKWLPFEAKENRKSFSGLVREVGGDVPPGAMLKELTRAECVKEVRPGVWKALKRQYSPSGVDFFQVQRFGECLHDLAQTIVTNMAHESSDPRLFEFRAWSDRIDRKEVPVLRSTVAAQGKSYLESIDDWLETHASKDMPEQKSAGQGKSGRLRCGVGVYYFETREEIDLHDSTKRT